MKKKKIIYVLGGIIACIIVLCSIAAIVDRSKTKNDEKPIFCYNLSGGSGILYIGPGYVIEGAYDGGEGGLPGAKLHSWIGFAGEIVGEMAKEILNPDIGIQENKINFFAKYEGILEVQNRNSQGFSTEEYIKYVDNLYNRGTGNVARIEPVEVEAEEHYIKIYAFNENDEIVWEYQTQKEPLIQFYSVEYITTDYWDNEIVIINDLGNLKALDLNTGKIKWSVKYNETVNVGIYDSNGNIYMYSRFSNKFTVVNNEGKIVKTIDIGKAEKDNNIIPCDKSDFVGIGMMDNIINISVKHTDEELAEHDEEEIYIDLNNWSIKFERESYAL